MDYKINSRNGQVTIFVILGILIVAVILLFIFLSSGGPSTNNSPESNPAAFLKNCLEQGVLDTVNLISLQGGFVQPENHKKFTFDGEDKSEIAYLCYTNQSEVLCINQQPLIIKHTESEIKNAVSPDVNECWDSLGQKLQDEGYVIEGQNNGFDIVIKEGRIEIPISSQLKLTKQGQTIEIKDQNIIIASDLYSKLILVSELNSGEASDCNFDYLNLRNEYPEYNLDKTRTLDGSEIYTISDVNGNKFRFAVRNCVPSQLS